MRRIFIAIKIHPDRRLKELVSSLRNGLAGENIKWVDPDNIHITLAFLGNMEEEKIDAVTRMLVGMCKEYGAFEFFLRGAGVFKSMNNPRIIWIGTNGSVELSGLNDVINEGLKDLGFAVEERPFHPHVTIGRIKFLKRNDNLKALIEEYRDAEIQKIHVEEVVLYESITGVTSPVYKPVSTARFRGIR